MREPHRREARLLDRGEIPAAALDVEDVLLVARDHALTHLDGRIAAAVQYQGVVASEQPRRIAAELKVSREARRLRVVPERFHGLAVIVLAIPGYEIPDPGLHRRRGAIPDIVHEIFHVRTRVRDIAWLERQQIDLRLLADVLFDELNVAHERRRLVASYVVNAVRRAAAGRVRVRSGPLGIRPCRLVEHAHDAFRNIVDVCETTGMLPVVEDIDRLVGKYLARKKKERHVRTSPRPIDGEKT